MGLRDILKKKENLGNAEAPAPEAAAQAPSLPEFKFIRSDTHSQEIVYPPSHSSTANEEGFLAADGRHGSRHDLRSLEIGSSGRSRSTSVSSQASATTKSRRRLSERLHLTRSPSSSEHVPQDMPEISVSEGVEDQWEHRATMLANATEMARSRPSTPNRSTPTRHTGPKREISAQAVDADIQEAIRLHEQGDLGKSTAIFARLADPKGANNPLSQVLYGLALRHGWGCNPDVSTAVTYLTAAASNAAAVEEMALQAGLKKGGAAKGELVLAIFELGNSFRHGWGTDKDPVAAKQYYETAANLGDTDAMNETAWCYLEGFGCKKDKFAAARYYRLAEKNGNKTLGNTWIWKEKYDPPEAGEESGKKKKRW